MISSWALGNYEKLLCCPSFDPQITGGVADPGDVTAKLSVRHWPISVTSKPSAGKLMNYRVAIKVILEGCVSWPLGY